MSSVAKLKSVTAQACGNCSRLKTSCSEAAWSDGAVAQCQKGITGMQDDIGKNNMPSTSQTGAERDGNWYPCCYVRDAMCEPTKGTDLFNPSIKALNAKHNISLKYGSSLSICEQLKKY